MLETRKTAGPSLSALLAAKATLACQLYRQALPDGDEFYVEDQGVNFPEGSWEFGRRWFENHYVCSECGEEWTGCWPAMCADRCPKCNTSIDPSISYDDDASSAFAQTELEAFERLFQQYPEQLTAPDLAELMNPLKATARAMKAEKALKRATSSIYTGFGKRSDPPCEDCDADGICTMNCGPVQPTE